MAKKKYQYDNLADLKRVGEPLMTMASGTIAEPVAGWGGILTGKAKTIKDLQDHLTYMPRTKEGKEGLQSLGKGISNLAEMAGMSHMPGYWKDEVIPALQSTLGDKIGSATGAGLIGAMAIAAPKGTKKISEGKSLKDLYTEDAYHLSRPQSGEPFDAFRIADDDLGVHTGTKAQANKRHDHFRTYDDYVSNLSENDGTGKIDPLPMNTLPLKGMEGKSVKVTDLGSWDDPDKIFSDLLDMDPFGGYKKEPIPKELRDKFTSLKQKWNEGREPGDIWHPTEEAKRSMRQEIRDVFLNSGYNKLRYFNEHETPNHILDTIRQEFGIEGRDASSLPYYKEELDLLRMRNSTDEIEDRIEAVEAIIDLLEGNEGGAYESTIWIDPKDVKSRNAKFKTRDDLLSSTGLMNIEGYA